MKLYTHMQVDPALKAILDKERKIANMIALSREGAANKRAQRKVRRQNAAAATFKHGAPCDQHICTPINTHAAKMLAQVDKWRKSPPKHTHTATRGNMLKKLAAIHAPKHQETAPEFGTIRAGFNAVSSEWHAEARTGVKGTPPKRVPTNDSRYKVYPYRPK